MRRSKALKVFVGEDVAKSAERRLTHVLLWSAVFLALGEGFGYFAWDFHDAAHADCIGHAYLGK